MFFEYRFEVASLLKSAEEIRYELRHPYVGTEHLLLALLKYENDVSNTLKKYGICYENFKNELLQVMGQASKDFELNLYTPMLKRVLEHLNGYSDVRESHLFMAMLEEGDGVGIEILLSMGVDLDQVYVDIKEKCEKKKSKKRKLEVFKVGILMNEKVDMNQVVSLRDKEITLLEEILLRKNKNNVILLGKAGVGKTAIVEEFVRRIERHDVPRELENVLVVNLEMSQLVAGTKYRGEFEERLQRIIREVKEEKNIILFIDEIHSMVHAGGAEGAICAGDILKPYLARGEISVIGATTIDEYHKFIEKDKALERRFEIVKVEEPKIEDMKVILHDSIPSFEKHYGISISKQNERDLIDASSKYLLSRNNPDKTLDLLDSVLASVKVLSSCKRYGNEEKSIENLEKKKESYFVQENYDLAISMAKKIKSIKNQDENISDLKITKQDIINMVERKSLCVIKKYPLLLKRLKQTLNRKILGQEDALECICDTLQSKNKRMVSFLLTGSSGVGKTKTVKIVSEVLKTEFIKIDMSEYSSAESIYKLIGVFSHREPYVLQKLKEHPYATVLFDEVEKAHPKILNMLLQILDDGYIIDSCGDKIYFNLAQIFLTSNILGANSIGFESKSKVSYDGFFSRELLGRIDAIVPYQKIGVEVATSYIHSLLKDVDASEILSQVDLERYGLREVNHLLNRYKKKTNLEFIRVS